MKENPVKLIVLRAAIALLVVMAATAASPTQTSTVTIRGTVVRSADGQGIPGVNVSLHPAVSFETLDAVQAAGSTLVGGQAGILTAPLLTMPQEQLEAQIANLKSMSVPQNLKDALDKLLAARKATADFPKTIVSDASGRFSFDGAPAGRYTVVTEKEGFYGVPPAGSSSLPPSASAGIDARNTNAVPEAVVRMIPGGLISGHVRDANGQLQSNTQVQAFTVIYNAGLPVFQTVAINQTDDRGEFRLFWLPPGEYYVAATPKPPAPAAVPGVRAGRNGGLAEGPVQKTFYPSSNQPKQATPIDVKIGEEISGINIDLRTTTTVKLSGQVVNGLGPRPTNPDGSPSPVPAARLLLVPRDMSAPEDAGARQIANLDVSTGSGKFEVAGIAPGLYDLYGSINDPRGSPGQAGATNAWGRIPVDVLDRDVSDLTIVVRPAVDMKGMVLINNAAPGAGAAAIRVGLQPDGSSSKLPNYNGIIGRLQTPTPEGAFTVPGISEGTYRFVVNGLPPNAYVEEIRAEGRPVFDSGIYVADKPVDGVQVLINMGGGTVQGTVITSDRKPAGRVTVVLVPEANHRQNASLYKTTTSNADGSFTLRGVHPGVYKVFAWESVANGAWLNSVFLSKVEGRGAVVNVTASSSEPVQVLLIPRS
jgi:hypothetical protein